MSADASVPAGRFAEIATDALRYWEPRRLVYDGVLALVVIGHFVAALPRSREALGVDWLLGLFMLAVLANALYCLAYVIDLFVQLSALRESWRPRRWLLLLLGTAFAAVLTHFAAYGALGFGRGG